jgi:hypothetical protein
MKTDMFFMKILTTESPYYQIVRGNYRYEEAVMAKADELKQDKRVQKIIIKKRENMRQIPKNYYKWDQGFETIYLGK